jgi:hypothetical protein
MTAVRSQVLSIPGVRLTKTIESGSAGRADRARTHKPFSALWQVTRYNKARGHRDVVTMVHAILPGHPSILFDLAIRPASLVGLRIRGGHRLRLKDFWPRLAFPSFAVLLADAPTG